MASIQVSHQRTCALGRTFRAPSTAGCTCEGVYYVFVRHAGKTHKHRAGKNKTSAKRLLTRLQGQEDERSYEPIRRGRFDACADEWLTSLERKPSTKDSYRVTVKLAKPILGRMQMQTIGVADIKRFDAALQARGISSSTRAKHLRAVHKFFEDAIANSYVTTNPVKRIPSSQRPRAELGEAAYFTREELVTLFGHVPVGLYRSLFLLGLKTGLRLGELLALRWADVNLTEGIIEVRRSYSGGRLGSPKSGKARTIHIPDDVVETLGAWWGTLGRPSDDALVFPGRRSGGFVNEAMVRRALYEAMEAAGIPRVGPSGAKRSFHSLRHSFAKLALEGGRPLYWLSKYLGHSSYAVTDGRYGHWEHEEKRKQADELGRALAQALPGI